ncbi:MAG: NAD(P)-dependent alcohol dehydrogenase [Planctomycetes bacterium]|nr:NAD(P)-dependent alcohol dehydrogenase [Planctomycetota bacterium]
MKTIVIQPAFGIENLQIIDRPEPKPGYGQVLLKMKAWSLNYRDLLVVKGLYNPKLKLPFVPLSDGVGEVIGVGDGVTRVKAGDRVAGCFMSRWLAGELTDTGAKSGLGGVVEGVAAEQVVLHEDAVVKFPAHLSDEEAATLPCAALTAWQSLVTQGHLRAGDTVLVQGTGGVSIFALQFARMFGARVIATSSSNAKLDRVKKLGASDGINYKETPAWEDKVKELTGGQGVDHVVEVGGAGTFNQSMKAVRLGGTVSLIGVLAGKGDVNLMPVLMKSVRVQGIFVGSREMFEAMNRAIALHQMKPVIDRVFAFNEIQAALRHMEAGAHFGKICVRI